MLHWLVPLRIRHRYCRWCPHFASIRDRFSLYQGTSNKYQLQLRRHSPIRRLLRLFPSIAITERIGRRRAIALSSVVFCIGGILQIVNTHNPKCFYAGRIISGLGVGAATVLVPMFSAEMSPKNIRGQLRSFFQLFFFSLGVLVSYW